MPLCCGKTAEKDTEMAADDSPVVQEAVAKACDVPPGTKKEVELRGRKLVIINDGGKFYCVNGICSHYNYPLVNAEIGGTIGLYVGATLLTIAETIVFFFEKRTRIALLKNPAPLDKLNSILTEQKNSFLRADWMSRVQRQVEIAQSYSPGPKYDEVNLLLVKVYFAHFKQETIKQEKSYNLFLLLAEIGGTIGLYVGATLLTIAETIVFFFEKRTRIALLKNPAPL